MSDFDRFIRGVDLARSGELEETYRINDQEVMIESADRNAKLYIYDKNERQNALTINMDDIVQKLQNFVSDDRHRLPVKELTF